MLPIRHPEFLKLLKNQVAWRATSYPWQTTWWEWHSRSPKATAPLASGETAQILKGGNGDHLIKPGIYTGPCWCERPKISQGLRICSLLPGGLFGPAPGSPGRSHCPGVWAAVWSCPLRPRSTAAGARPPSYSSRQWPPQWGSGPCGAGTWRGSASSRKGSSVWLWRNMA